MKQNGNRERILQPSKIVGLYYDALGVITKKNYDFERELIAASEADSRLDIEQLKLIKRNQSNENPVIVAFAPSTDHLRECLKGRGCADSEVADIIDETSKAYQTLKFTEEYIEYIKSIKMDPITVSQGFSRPDARFILDEKAKIDSVESYRTTLAGAVAGGTADPSLVGVVKGAVIGKLVGSGGGGVTAAGAVAGFIADPSLGGVVKGAVTGGMAASLLTSNSCNQVDNGKRDTAISWVKGISEAQRRGSTRDR